jgi:hypothetical protein
MKRLLDFDPLSGMRTWHDYDDATETTIISYEEDVQPVLDSNKDAQNEQHGRMGDMVHVASIPPSVQMKWWVEKGVAVWNQAHKQAVARLLDDPEWLYLKRRPIMLGRVRNG